MFALVAFVAAVQVVALGLWGERMEVPFVSGGDANAHSMLLKSVVDHGWVAPNPNLGAPFGQHIYDQPQPDVLHLVLGGTLLGGVTDWSTGMNLYYLAVPLLAALTMAWLLHRLRIATPVTFVVSALFALGPYHFLRNEYHLFLGAIYHIPLCVMLVLGALGVLPLFERRPGSGRSLRPWLTKATVTTLGLAAVVGAAGAYYAAFTVILLVLAALVRGLGAKRLRSVMPPLFVAGAILAVQAACVLPAVVWRAENGPNPEAAQRAAADTDVYGLKLTQLLLPMQVHRVDRLGQFTQEYLETFPLPSEAVQSLGLVAAAGLVGSLVACLVALAGSRPRAGPGGTVQVAQVGTLNLALILYATVGGLASLISFTVWSQFRSVNRVSIFISVFSFIAVAHWLDRLWGRARVRPSLRWVAVSVLAGVLVVGLVDQTSGAFAPADSRLATWDSDKRFVEAIEQRLGRGAMVYQLPYVRFPEQPPVNRMQDYDHMRGYFHSETLRWSYGGMKGRAEGEWPVNLQGATVPEMLRGISIVGFRGVYVDRFGFTDEAVGLERALQEELGVAPLVSDDGRLSFFDITAYAAGVREEMPDAAEMQLEAALLSLPPVGYGTGFHGLEQSPTERWRWTMREADLELRTRAPSRDPVPVRFRVEAGMPGQWTMRLIEADGTEHRLVVDEEPRDITVPIVLSGERTKLRMVTDAPRVVAPNESRDLRLRVIDVSFGAADIRSLLHAGS